MLIAWNTRTCLPPNHHVLLYSSMLLVLRM